MPRVSVFRLLKKIWFPLKRRQSIRRLPSQLVEFDPNFIFGNAACDRQKNVVVNEGTNDQEFTVDNTGSKLTTKIIR